MTAIEKVKEIQKILGVAADGHPLKQTNVAVDNLFAEALREIAEDRAIRPPNGKIIIGEGWAFNVSVDGQDLLMRNVGATAFGGDSDPLDNGETASGYRTRGHPDLMAVSLPMAYAGSQRALREALGGSPIPRMPFGLKANGEKNPGGTFVIVTDRATGAISEPLPVIDIGPARWTKDALDMTVAAAKKINPRATANNFSARVDVRILGAAKYVKT